MRSRASSIRRAAERPRSSAAALYEPKGTVRTAPCCSSRLVCSDDHRTRSSASMAARRGRDLRGPAQKSVVSGYLRRRFRRPVRAGADQLRSAAATTGGRSSSAQPCTASTPSAATGDVQDDRRRQRRRRRAGPRPARDLLLRTRRRSRSSTSTAATARSSSALAGDATYSGWITARRLGVHPDTHSSRPVPVPPPERPDAVHRRTVRHDTAAARHARGRTAIAIDRCASSPCRRTTTKARGCIQRETGKPTTLSRHTRAARHADDVERRHRPAGGSAHRRQLGKHAAHSGASRSRRVELQRPFIDPALAVWRVGQPAPRALRRALSQREWNKGFVHVDVDKIESGEPFVFNSGAYP